MAGGEESLGHEATGAMALAAGVASTVLEAATGI